jgi:hypothetical protein
MKEQEPPPLSGPSGFGQSLNVTVSPDVIFQDGASQSVVTVNARGQNGPLANTPLRAEISVGGVTTDFGTLSARNIVTDGNGRATVVYTAPATPTGPVVDEFRLVNISITPVGNDFGNAVSGVTTLRLVPPSGVIIAPPDGLVPVFTFSPAAPVDHETVLFDASDSTAPTNNPIAQYRWDFGEGSTGSGRTTTHAFNSAGTFSVTLSLVDAYGRSRSTAQAIIVGAGATPIARFNFSPTVQSINREVFFNAAESTASPGRRIVNYFWNYGDGTSGNDGQTPRHAYARAATYVVTLTVTDDAGRTNTAQSQVTITP